MGTLGQAKYIARKYKKRAPYEPLRYERREVSVLVYKPRKFHSPLYEKRIFKSRKYSGRRITPQKD